MKSRAMQILTALTALAGASRLATAADVTSPWSLSISGGDSVAESGALRSPTLTNFSDLGTLDPALTGSNGTLRLDRLKYDDLFRRRFDTGLELDYSFNDNLQSYGHFGYDSLGGRTSTIGELMGSSSDAPMRAHFADAANLSLQVGSRYFWPTGTSWRPFAGFALGATHLDAMRATLTSPGLTPDLTDLNDLRFTRTGTVFSQSLETGVDYSPTAALGLRFSVDANHIGAPPDANDARLGTLGFGPGNDAHSLWSFPVSVAANYHF